MKSSTLAGLFALSTIGLVSVAGCSSAPDEDNDVGVSSAAVQTSATCRVANVSRRYSERCEYPPTATMVSEIVRLARGAAGCASTVVGTVSLASGVTWFITPGLVMGADSCMNYIHQVLTDQFDVGRCWRTELPPGPPSNPDYCAMECGGTQRTGSGGVCYCGTVPGGCNDTPTATATPPAPGR